MPSHCAVCGHTDFTHWHEYVSHMAQKHNVIAGGKPKIVPLKTSTRSKSQIVDALERKLGKRHFFNYTPPGVEDAYAAFVRGLRQ